MRTKAKFRIGRQLLSVKVRCVRKVKASVGSKIEICDFFELPGYCCNTAEMVAYIHRRPSFVQRNAGGMFHDNVLASDIVRDVVAPV
jgi:hypothetical protein